MTNWYVCTCLSMCASTKKINKRLERLLRRINSGVLTVVAVRPSVGRHGAFTGEVLPLLDAHAHVGAGVLLAGRTWTCMKVGDRRRHGRTALPSIVKSDFWALNNDRFMQNKCTTERETTCGGGGTVPAEEAWPGQKSLSQLFTLLNGCVVTCREVFVYSAGDMSDEFDSIWAAVMALSTFIKSKCVLVDTCMQGFFFCLPTFQQVDLHQVLSE